VSGVQGQTEYYTTELLLNSKLRVFAVNCSLLYGGHNTVHAQLHVKSKRGQLQSSSSRMHVINHNCSSIPLYTHVKKIIIFDSVDVCRVGYY